MFSQTVHAVAATVGFTSWLLLWGALVLGLVVRNGWASTACATPLRKRRT